MKESDLNWERQLEAILEEDRMDPETLADLGIAYAAETGDESLFRPPFSFFIELPPAKWVFRQTESASCTQSRGLMYYYRESDSISSHFRHRNRSDSSSRALSRSGTGSVDRFRSRVLEYYD